MARPTPLSGFPELLPAARVVEREVIASAEKHAGRKLSNGVDVFTEIRAWKNAF